MTEQEQAVFDAQVAAISAMEPRGYKPNQQGAIGSFSVDEYHLNSRNQLVSIQGTATRKNEDNTYSEPFSVLWNVNGGCIHNNDGAKLLLDLVLKVVPE